MSKRFGVTFDCRQPVTLATFWCDLLGYIEEPPPDGYQSWQDYDRENDVTPDDAENGCTIVDPEGRGPRIYFQRVPEPKTAKNRVHLDVVVSSERAGDSVIAAAQRAVAAGGRIVTESSDPTDRFIVMADPEGNEFCLVM
jgi:hypothetical protein